MAQLSIKSGTNLLYLFTYFEQRPAQKDNEWQAIVLWLNGEDDPGFGTLKLLARRPKPRLVAVDLLALLKKLDEHALVLNVLRPLLVAEEQIVRGNVVQYPKEIVGGSGVTWYAA